MYMQAIVYLHVGAGAAALAGFWTAMLLAKGTPLHRRIGRVYAIAISIVLLTTPLLVGAAVAAGSYATGAFLSYLIVITGTALWIAWRAIRLRNDPVRFHGPAYRAVAFLNLASGAATLALGARLSHPLVAGVSLIGLALGASMLRDARRAPEPGWWLRAHYGAILGTGIAAHVAFVSIGLDTLLPGRELATQMITWGALVAIAVLARRRFAAKYGRAARAQQREVRELFPGSTSA